MASIMTAESAAISSQLATAQEVHESSIEHEQELIWLAEFLTNDESIARTCVIDSCTLIESESKVSEECLSDRLRDATIRSVLDIQRVRIAQLSLVYAHCPDCIRGEFPALSRDMMELVVMESGAIALRLDTLCRFVLILLGFEHRSKSEAALLLRVSEHVVENAYCAALELLEGIRCQTIFELLGCTAPN